MTAYWITTYIEVHDQSKVDAYAALAGPVLEAAGARFLARGFPAATYEAGRPSRCVVIEFASVEAAVTAYESRAYASALEALGDGATRDVRIVDAG